jgi:hypothetical protein
MGTHDYQRLEVSASFADSDIGRSKFLRQAARRTGILIVSLLGGLAVGAAYRFLFDPADERGLAKFFFAARYGGRVGRPRRADGICVRGAVPVGLGVATIAARGRTRRPSGRYGRRGGRG